MSQAGPLNEVEVNPEIPTIFITDSGIAIPSANTLEILGGTGITTSGSGNIITISLTGTGFTWQVVTSADNPVHLVTANGYIAKGVAPVQFVLPAAAAIGDTYKIVGYGNLWTLAQNANQTIDLGIVATTVGVGGSVTATFIKDSIELVNVTINTEFNVVSSIGNLTIV